MPSSIPPAAIAALRRHLLWCTLVLCATTAVMSVWVTIHISGKWPGRVRIVDLEPWGLRWHHLRELELWRLVTAQLVHVKPPHMLANVVCLGLVGAAVERHVGGARLFAIWLVGECSGHHLPPGDDDLYRGGRSRDNGRGRFPTDRPVAGGPGERIPHRVVDRLRDPRDFREARS